MILCGIETQLRLGDGPTVRKNGSDQRSILFVMAMHPHSDVPFLGRVSSLSCPF
jgi:hypothetical protein